MRPIKIPKFPYRAYHIISHFSIHGSRIEVYEVEIIGYEEPGAWVYKYTNRTVWQTEPRFTSDAGTYRSSDFENFCYDLYSVKMRVETLKKEFLNKLNSELGFNENETHSLLKKLVELNNNSRNIKKSLQTLEEAQFPDLRSLYEKF